MIKSIKRKLTGLVATLTLLVPVAVPAVVMAQPNIQESLCGGVNLTTDPTACTQEGNENAPLNNIITLVINVFSVIVGFIAIVMMIYGGFKYITSSGDSGNVTAAKNTIMYALIGLIIVALAQIIVRFVLAKSFQASNGAIT